MLVQHFQKSAGNVPVWRTYVTRAGLLPKAPAVDPGSAVPPDAPYQPQTVRLYAAQVAWDLAPKPAAAYRRTHPALVPAVST